MKSYRKTKLFGTSSRPRLYVKRTANHIYAQIIDDDKGKTLLSASDFEIKGKGKVGLAFSLGKKIAEKALAKKISKVVFDRGANQYHGRVKSLAEGAREGGLKF